MNKIIDDCNAHRGPWNFVWGCVIGLLAVLIDVAVELSTGSLVWGAWK